MAKIGGHRRKSIKTFARTTGRARGWRQRSFRNPLTRNRTPPAFAFHRRCMRRFYAIGIGASRHPLAHSSNDYSIYLHLFSPPNHPSLPSSCTQAWWRDTKCSLRPPSFFHFFLSFFFFFRERQRRGGESFSSVTTLFLKHEGKMGQVLWRDTLWWENEEGIYTISRVV